MIQKKQSAVAVEGNTTDTSDSEIVARLRIEALEAIRRKHGGIDAGSQTRRLLEAIQTLGGISTIEAHRHLDILHPPARKLDLLKSGHIVELGWVYESSDCGKIHRVGKYYYLGKMSYPLFDGLDGELFA